jgi:hypothetical protein
MAQNRYRSVEVSGEEDITRRLQRMNLTQAQVKKVLYPAGRYLQLKIKNAAKGIDDHKRTTEDLKYRRGYENIWLEWDERNKTTYITTGDAYWLYFKERSGSKGVTQKKKYRLNKQASRKNRGFRKEPFMEPVYRANKAAIERLIAIQLKKELGL